MVQQYDGRVVIVGTDCIENDVKSDIMPCNMRNHDVKNAINAKYTESKMPSHNKKKVKSGVICRKS